MKTFLAAILSCAAAVGVTMTACGDDSSTRPTVACSDSTTTSTEPGPASATTWVYYSPMTIYGYKSGYLVGEVWRTKSGDCVDLLDFPDVTLQRTYDWYY